jgi:hypothetical protein
LTYGNNDIDWSILEFGQSTVAPSRVAMAQIHAKEKSLSPLQGIFHPQSFLVIGLVLFNLSALQPEPKPFFSIEHPP